MPGTQEVLKGDLLPLPCGVHLASHCTHVWMQLDTCNVEIFPPVAVSLGLLSARLLVLSGGEEKRETRSRLVLAVFSDNSFLH